MSVHPKTPDVPPINTRRTRLAVLMLLAATFCVGLIWFSWPPPEWLISPAVRDCTAVTERWLVDDNESIEISTISEFGSDQRSTVALRFRHLDRTGHYRLKDVDCSFSQGKLFALFVDGKKIPFNEDGLPSLNYLLGPEYHHLR